MDVFDLFIVCIFNLLVLVFFFFICLNCKCHRAARGVALPCLSGSRRYRVKESDCKAEAHFPNVSERNNLKRSVQARRAFTSLTNKQHLKATSTACCLFFQVGAGGELAGDADSVRFLHRAQSCHRCDTVAGVQFVTFARCETALIFIGNYLPKSGSQVSQLHVHQFLHLSVLLL